MKENHHVLYGKGVYGTNIWEVWSEANVIFMKANGGLYSETVKEGKASRSLHEQVKLRVDARVRSKLDNGMKYDITDLDGLPTNQLNLALPMLATPLKNVTNLVLKNCYYQPKLDGHRCLITREGSEIIAYSRRGKLIDTITHITHDLNIPQGVTLDGELYCHGEALQTIASWAKRKQANTEKLKFHAYDILLQEELDRPFEERFEILSDIANGNKIELVNTMRCSGDYTISDYYRMARDRGYEGAILRPKDGVYSAGKRPKHLIKVKMRHDAEFKCVDIIPSRDGFGILILETPEGKRFKTVAPGTVYQKTKTLHNKQDFIGKYVTCEYADLTKDNIPFHCVAIRWRIDI